MSVANHQIEPEYAAIIECPDCGDEMAEGYECDNCGHQNQIDDEDPWVDPEEGC